MEMTVRLHDIATIQTQGPYKTIYYTSKTPPFSHQKIEIDRRLKEKLKSFY